MSSAPTVLQGISTPLDGELHPAASTLQDVRVYARALVRYWIDTANWVEDIAAGRAVIPVIAACATILGAAIVGVNL